MIFTVESTTCQLASEHEVCSTFIVLSKELTETQRLQIRALTDGDFLCEYHFQKQINLFHAKQNKCCDPLLRHKRVINAPLRNVTYDFYNQVKHGLSIIPGQKVCRSCFEKHIPEWLIYNPAENQMQSSTTSSQFESQQSHSSTQRCTDIELAKESIKNVQEILLIESNEIPINKVSIRRK